MSNPKWKKGIKIVGVDGKTPKAGEDFEVPEGKPGKDADEEAILKKLIKRIPAPIPGDPGEPGEPGQPGRDADETVIIQRIVSRKDEWLDLSSESLVKKLSDLEYDKRLSYNDLKDAPKYLGRQSSRDYDFLELKDVPSSYKGMTGKSVRVNAAENALEFYTPTDVGGVWGSVTGTITAQTDLITLLGNYALKSSLAIANWNAAFSWGNHASAEYLTNLAGAVLTSQVSPQTIGLTGSRLAKLWATDITMTNALVVETGGGSGSYYSDKFTNGGGNTFYLNNATPSGGAMTDFGLLATTGGYVSTADTYTGFLFNFKDVAEGKLVLSRSGATNDANQILDVRKSDRTTSAFSVSPNGNVYILGNLAIGKATAAFKVDVEVTTNGFDGMTFTNKSSGGSGAGAVGAAGDGNKSVYMASFGSGKTGNWLGQTAANLNTLYGNNSPLAIGTIDNYSLYFGTNNATRMMIDNAGSVAINNTTGGLPLSVTAATDYALPTSNTRQGTFAIGNTTNAYGLIFGVSTATGKAWISSQRFSGGVANYPILLNPLGSYLVVGGDTALTGGTAAGSISLPTAGSAIYIKGGGNQNTELAGDHLKVGQATGLDTGYFYAKSDNSIGASLYWGKTSGAGVSFANVNFIPTSNYGFDLGYSSFRWNKLLTHDITADGTNVGFLDAIAPFNVGDGRGLHIKSDQLATLLLHGYYKDAGTTSYASQILFYYSATSQTRIQYDPGSATWLFTNEVSATDATHAYGDTIFKSKQAGGTTLVEAMRIRGWNGNVGFQTGINPTAKAHLGAGTTVAGTAPLKLTQASAALLTAPEPGAIECNDGDLLYYTIKTGSARKVIAFENAISGTFTTVDGKTITITNGLVTNIV